MNDRVHACLDGELPREALSAEERARLAALEAALEGAASTLRAAPVPDLTARVMAGLPASPPAAVPAAPLWRRVQGWLWRPRPVSFAFRPAYGLAGLAAAALALLLVPSQGTVPPVPLDPVAAEAGAGAPRLYVQFRLEAPSAREVRLAGSFSGWQPSHELREAAPGVWTALVPLEPGVHDYTFVVDGQEWVVDPYAPTVEDSFGGRNSRLFLPAPLGSA